MALNFAAWLSENGIEVSAAVRAGAAWKRIQDKPTTLTLLNREATVTVRVEYDSASADRLAETANTAVQRVWLFGIRDHETLADTDLVRGDEFELLDGGYKRFRIVDVILQTGEMQFIAEAIS